MSRLFVQFSWGVLLANRMLGERTSCTFYQSLDNLSRKIVDKEKKKKTVLRSIKVPCKDLGTLHH